MKEPGRNYRGVTRKKRRWQAQINDSGIIRYLGLFSNETQAALAYDRAAIELYGTEGAKLNFPLRVQY